MESFVHGLKKGRLFLKVSTLGSSYILYNFLITFNNFILFVSGMCSFVTSVIDKVFKSYILLTNSTTYYCGSKWLNEKNIIWIKKNRQFLSPFVLKSITSQYYNKYIYFSYHIKLYAKELVISKITTNIHYVNFNRLCLSDLRKFCTSYWTLFKQLTLRS